MNLHQFRFVQEAVRRDLNLTETAKALFTSQPGVSKAILELEGELGVDIFARHGKRLRRVTEPGPRSAEGDRGDHARGRQPEAHRRRVLEAGRRHALDRDDAQPGALLPAGADRADAKALPEGQHQPAPGHARAGREDGLRGGRRLRPRDRIARRLRRPRHPALLRLAARARAAGRPPAGAGRPRLARRPGAAAADLLPPVVLGPKAHRRRVRDPQARAEHRPRGDRRRRHQDLRPPRPGRRHRRRDRDARGRRRRRPGGAPGRPPVRPERRPHRLQARRLPAQLRLRVRRDDLRPPDPAAGRAGDGRRRPRTTSSE